ncbi:MAG: hypothetical protein JXA89_19725, partial [Anaerolineae bacterium]|nr:hypothetical protein [Anaerolineae bacterium]
LTLRATFEAAGPNPYAYGPRTTIGTLLEDPQARALLLKYLPREAIGVVFGLVAQFIPEMPIEAMFSSWMVRMPQADEGQIAALKARLYAELAAIEV